MRQSIKHRKGNWMAGNALPFLLTSPTRFISSRLD